MLKCPVCNEKLNKVNSSYICKNKHNYDISKYGYTNLLLANHYNSLHPGDDKEMVMARKDFFNSDKYRILKEKLLEILKEYSKKETILCDVGCGEGYYTNYLHYNLSKYVDVNTIGIDISKYAIIEACKESRNLSNIDYVIANINRLPIINESCDIILNCFAPIDDKEFYRILKDKGVYIRVLPGKNHLFGLKQELYDNPYYNEKKEERLNGFILEKEIDIEDVIELNKKEIISLFKMTPYYYKSKTSSLDKLEQLYSLKTEISFNIRIYKKNHLD